MRIRLVSTAIILLCSAAIVVAQDEKPTITSLPKLPANLHDAMQSKEFNKAIELIDAGIQKGDIEAVDYWFYLKGRAQTELKQYDPAMATLRNLEQRFPKSRWLARSRFQRAEVFVRQRNYRAAGAIYQNEAKRLLSDGRKDELASIYLEFADRHFEGVVADDPSKQRKPDYKQALTYYQESLKLKPSLERRQKVELRIARCHQELKQLPQAIAAYQKYLKDHGTDENRAPAELEIQARFQLGSAQLAAGQREQARKTWQDFLANEIAKESAGELLAEATYRLAHTYGIPAPGNDSDLELGVAALEKFLKAYPKHKLAAQTEFEIAQSYGVHGRFEQTVARLKSLIGNPAYQGTKQIPQARSLLGQAFAAQKKYTEAITAWQEFLNQHPTDSNWSNVQRVVINTEFAMAAEQMSQKNYAAARKLWETFLNKYPLDTRAASILFRFGQMQYAEAVGELAARQKQAKEDGEEFDRIILNDDEQKLFEAAIADWRRLVSKYPKTNDASYAAYSIGITLEDRLAKLPEALEAYKQVTGSYVNQAKQRIANLTAKQLEILTERKFRSDETATIKLTTRNIEEVSVKIYRIDMVDYFRKMHLATGIESLDIALIDPDKSWDHKVDGYEQYGRTENEIEIPVDGPGVTAVTVSSEKQEVTTMLIVSDIDMIVKSSRNELFVFAQNMRTGKPAEGVSLLISDGKEVFAEEITADDGVLQKNYNQLKSIKDLRVFAVREGHAASTVTNLNGLNFAVGLSAKGYLYTDRPAYRAGQLVNIKGIIRWVSGDQYTFKEGALFKLDVYDARGRVIHNGDVALNKFGSFADHFMLPATSPQGDYRIHVHQTMSKQSYETNFAVHEYKLEPVQISVDLPRTVYYRGEKIEGKIALKYYYGTPLAGKSIHYRLGNGRQHSATTDDKGEVKFEFETRTFNETQQLQLRVEFAERNLALVKPIHLATRGFAISTSTLREVYISGETFDVTINVSDPSGEPVATDLKLEVLERIISGDTKLERRLAGRAGERLVATHDLKSDKEDGEARQTVRIDKAGFYILRATGTDRFGNPVSGSGSVSISGDDDKVRLRLLADQHHFKVGDTGKVQIHWRDAPSLALVTYEGASILGYRLIPLKTGANAVEIPMDSKLAPNFDLAVAVMDGSKFHQSRSQFRVARRLNVTLKTDKKTLKPGDELKVEITTTDPQGKPISAELSLGLIQQNLLDLFGERQSDIQEFFAGGSRKVSVRATTSCTFRYRPATRGISQTLLAEAERVRIRVSDGVAVADLLIVDAAVAYDREALSRPGLAVGQPPSSLALKENAINEQLLRLNSRAMADGIVTELSQSLAAKPNYTLEAFGRGSNGSGQMGGGGAGFATNVKALDALARSESKRFEMAYRRSRSLDRLSDKSGKPSLARQSIEKNFANSVMRRSLVTNLADRWDTNGDGAVDLFFDQNSDNFGINVNNWSFVVPQQEQVLQSPGMYSFFTGISRTDKSVVALNGRGEFQVVNGLEVAALKDMARGGMELLPGMSSAETAYWNPLVVTDKNGKATVTFRLPDRSTAWTLRTKGADVNVLAGDASASVITKRDLFGELKTPMAFAVGDKTNILVEVHNSIVKKSEQISVRLKSTVGETTTEITRSYESAGPGIKELSIPVEIPKGDSVAFELTVSSGELTDKNSRNVTIRPYGVPVFATASGSAAQSTIAFVAHDKTLPVQNPELEIIVGPSVNRTLLDAVLGGGISRYESSLATPRSGFERSISDVLGGINLLKMIGQTRTADTPQAQALSGRVQAAISQIISSQRDDGGWSWSGRSAAASDRFITSRVVWALSDARKAGFAVPNDTFNKAVTSLKTAFTKSAQTDREGQAIILHGLAKAGAADFAFANRLYRERNNLSPSGLLHVALILSQLDRKNMAADLLKLVNVPLDIKLAQRSIDTYADRCLPWMQTGVELRALYLLALEEVSPADANAPKVADWLMAARRGSRWNPEKANGPAIAALANWFAGKQNINEKYTLTVYVNDELIEKLEIDPSSDPSRRLRVPAEHLEAGKQQRINFDIEGRGRFSYSAVLSGFVAADQLKNTTQKWYVTRTYEPAKRMLDGKEIPRGFGILSGSFTSFRNPLTQLPLGDRGEVTLHVRRRYSSAEWTRNQWDYLVVTEPIPAGAMVLTESITGKFERYEISAGAITFYLGDERSLNDIHYTLVGYLPGNYRTVPTVVRSFYRPERMAVAKAKSLDVLPRGGKTRDEYRLSPVELYEFGKRAAAKEQYQGVREHLANLFKNWRLNDKTYKHVVQLLFRAALETGQHQEIVEYFEIIKEKYSDIEIDFDSILKVADAYRELGEYERGYLVFRATIEAAFQRESQITGFLNGRGEFLRSVQIMERLLADYPSESYVATATLALAGEVYGKASEAAADKKLKEAGIGRVDLIADSIRMHDHLLTTWPLDPAADQASFALASSLLDLEQFEATIARSERFGERYPDSELLDSFWYMIGYSQFALGQHEAALETCRKVAEAVRKDPRTGIELEARNKWQAVYIMGQIHHSLGSAAEAIAEYKRVIERFADANEAVQFFTRKDIKLPEITTVKPGDESKVDLKYRNVAAASIKVYRIDLLKFSLLQRNLDRITAINLAGIRPYHELELELGDGKDYRDRAKALALPLKEEGAYLVVCRGDNLYTSGLVLVSPLTLEIQEDKTSGRVRVTVKDTVAERFAPDVHVKVIGSSNKAFTDGETDLRGIFIADAIQGTSTIIAKADQNRYAFHIGKNYLGKPPAPQKKSQKGKAAAASQKRESGKELLLRNLMESNDGFNSLQRDNYRKLLGNDKQGVKADEAF